MHKRNFRYTFDLSKKEKTILMKNHLNKNEETVMRILWKLKKAFLKEVVQEFPEPKLPSTTIASIIKKLEQKELIGHETFNKSHQYYPKLKEEDYKHVELKSMMSTYFNSSLSEMVSFFMKKEDADLDELEKLYDEIKKKAD